MAGQYKVAATLWRDQQGVRHRRGDVVTPPESEVDRLVRAKAIVPVAEIDPSVAEQEARAKAEADRLKAEQATAEAARAEAERLAAEQGMANQVQQVQSGQVPPRPKVAATKPLWEAYATARGVDVTDLDKDEIIAAVDALDAK